MPAVKSIPIRDPENDSVVGQYFEASTDFQNSLSRNYVTMSNGKREIRANKKLVHHYTDKGYEVAAKGKQEKT